MALSCIAAVAIATLVWRTNFKQTKLKNIPLLQLNVEALSSQESGAGYVDYPCNEGREAFASIASAKGETTWRWHKNKETAEDYETDYTCDEKWKVCLAEGIGKKKGSDGIRYDIDISPIKEIKCDGPLYHNR